MSTMQALAWRRDAGRMALIAAPVPQPGAGEILVEMRASAVNEMDVQVRAGGWARQVAAFERRGPVVTGFEFAGIARSDGARIKSGDRVIGYVHVLKGPRVHAGYAAIAERDMEVIPDDLGFEDAAALVCMGLTAIEITERLRPLKPGQRALVIGATGGVGVYTVQLAKAQGAAVTAVCRLANADWIKSQGASAVRDADGPVPQPGDAFDLIVDVPAAYSFAKVRGFLTRGGMYVTLNPFADPKGFVRARFSLRRAGWLLMLTTTPAKLQRLIALWRDGALKPAIDRVFPGAEADAAFDRFAARGKRGRVLLTFGG